MGKGELLQNLQLCFMAQVVHFESVTDVDGVPS